MKDLFDGDSNNVCVAAKAGQRDDTVAGMESRDRRANGVDGPGDLVTDDARRPRRVGI